MGFNPFTITTQGAILASKTLIGKELKFTKFKVGDGDAPDDIKSLEELVNPIMPVALTSILRTTPIQVTVKALLKNTDAPQNFYWKELGLYAQDPDTKEEVLFAYAHYGENPEYIVNSISQPIDRYIQQIITVDNADNVVIEINPDTVFVTHQELDLEINKLKKKAGKIYGIRRLINNSSSAWERLEDAAGLVANATKDGTAVQNDFDNIYPWSDIISYNYDIKEKKNTAYYGEPTFKFDGSNGEVLTKIPEFWYKREQNDGYEYVYFADYAADGFIKSEQFSVGRYMMSGSSSRVYSKSKVAIFTNYTITNARNYARALGPEFGINDWHYFLLQLLYLVEYANYNNQSVLGQGYTLSTNTEALNGGGCDSLGMKSGCLVDDGLHSVIYRGIEDIFGNVWEFIDGINIKDYQAYICYDSDKYAVDTFDGAYQKLGYIDANAEGYASKLGYDPKHPLISLTTEAKGSSSTHLTDYYYVSAGNKIALVGGRWYHGLKAGLWYWHLDDASSDAGTNLGARLLKNQ